MTQGEP